MSPTKIIIHLSLATILVACGAESNLPASERIIPAEAKAGQRDAHRKLAFAGAHNFRDLGGYIGAQGRQVKWGLIYRSDALDELSTQDQALLSRIGFKQIVDFRTGFEKDDAPDLIPNDLRKYYIERPIDVEGTNAQELMESILSGDTEGLDLENMLVIGNRAFITDMLGPFRSHVHSLLDPKNLPSVAHCTAGKDRAGFAAAMTLLALGVSREDILKDYMLTNKYTEKEVTKLLWVIRFASLFRTDPETIRPLLTVKKHYLQAAFDAIDKDYASDEDFIRNGLQLDDQQLATLRDLLLEPKA